MVHAWNEENKKYSLEYNNKWLFISGMNDWI